MTGGFPLLGSLGNAVSIHDDVGGSFPAVLTAPGANNTKSAYTALVGSTTSDTSMMLLQFEYGNTAGARFSVDIAVGAGGAEQIIVADIFLGTTQSATFQPAKVMFPVAIPAGTRIAARYQVSTTIGTSLFLGATLFDGGFTQSQPGVLIETVGFTGGTTASTAITPGNGTKGAYAPLTTATTADYAGFFFDLDLSLQTATLGIDTYIDIAIGAGGVEQIIVPNFHKYRDFPSISPFFSIPIPSGTRIAARANSTNTTGLGIVMHGLGQ